MSPAEDAEGREGHGLETLLFGGAAWVPPAGGLPRAPGASGRVGGFAAAADLA